MRSPGALAARLAFPDRPVVAFTGDGGFMMALAELQTAEREKLPIIVVVFDDEEIGLIRVKQEIKGILPFGVHLGGVDWEKLGQAFGANAVVVETEQALSNALSAALKSSSHDGDYRARRWVGLCGPVQCATGAVSQALAGLRCDARYSAATLLAPPSEEAR